MTLLEKLQELGTNVEERTLPGGSYQSVVIRNTLASVAIQLPIDGNKFLYRGVLGRDITTEEGYRAARLAAINVLKQVNHFIPESRLVGLNHIDVMYQCDVLWDEGPAVANGASDLFLEILGTRGEHTRSIAGVHRLPRNFCVAVVASFTVLGDVGV